MEQFVILSLYVLSCLCCIPCFVCGRMANMHNPSAGVDKDMALWSLLCGLLAWVLSTVAMVWMYFNAVNYKA